MQQLGPTLAVLLLMSAWISTSSAEDIPKVRTERPRIYLRAKAWDGPSIEKIKGWMDRPDYKQRIEKLGRTIYGQALLYLINGDEAAGRKAVDAFKKHRIEGDTTTRWGDSCQEAATLYDWLRSHPDFDEATRKAKIAELEKWGDKCVAYFKDPETPFYCRYSAVVAGIAHIGLALAGDSPRADEFVRVAGEVLRDKFGTIRQMEDGATGGSSYGYNWEFTHLANMVAAWRSASDWDAGQWIRHNQGDWLRRQMLFQIWTTYPNGWFIKDGDVWSGSHVDHRQFRMQIDTVAGIYRSGVGRAWAETMFKRHGVNDYHSDYTWQFFVFNDPEIPPRLLEDLGRAEVFSPKLHGYVCWRDSWKEDSTVIHFKCGETVDHHGTWDQGKFMIFRQTPLAIKNGSYLGGYKSSMHLYYKSPWSTNCVVFTGPKHFGYQPYIDFDGSASWTQWKVDRDKRYKRPPTGVLLATESNENWARALGDLTGACPEGTSWRRELVFLGYKYLLVLDRVKAGSDIRHRWLLHTIHQPKVDGPLVVADNAPGRLFCRTLLPAEARMTDNSGPGKEYLHLTQKGEVRTLTTPEGKHWDKFDPARTPNEMQLGVGRVDVEPAGDGAECVYLHVLYPTDTKTARMPDCSVEQDGSRIRVKVGELSHAFGPQGG